MNGNNEESTREKKITLAEENEKLFLIFHKPCGKAKKKKEMFPSSHTCRKFYKLPCHVQSYFPFISFFFFVDFSYLIFICFFYSSFSSFSLVQFSLLQVLDENCGKLYVRSKL